MRSISIKLVQGLAAIGAVMLLTGANGGGCGGGSGGGGGNGAGPGEPPPEPCPDGTHLDVVCHDSGCEDPPQCYEECVPDGECRPDTEPVVVCGGGGMVPPDPGCDDDGNCAEPLTYPEPPPDEPPPDKPLPDDCWVECVPIDNCGPGFYEEWVCEDGGPDQPVCSGIDCPPPPEPFCYPICVPIDTCGPGYHEEWVCWGYGGGGAGGSSGGGQDEPSPPPPDGGYCDFICVPDSMCPPDFYPATVCDPDGTCWEECIPYDGEPLPG
jgi:hypothetical protein